MKILLLLMTFIFSTQLWATDFNKQIIKLPQFSPNYWPAPAITTTKMHSGRFIATITPIENVQLVPAPDESLTQPETPYQSAYAIPTWTRAEREIISYQHRRDPASLIIEKHDLMHWEHPMP